VPTAWYFSWDSVASTGGDLSALVMFPLLLLVHLLSIANAFAWGFGEGRTWVTNVKRLTLTGWFVVAIYSVFLLTKLSLTGVLFAN
jgi:hypothetical protein